MKSRIVTKLIKPASRIDTEMFMLQLFCCVFFFLGICNPSKKHIKPWKLFGRVAYQAVLNTTETGLVYNDLW